MNQRRIGIPVLGLLACLLVASPVRAQQAPEPPRRPRIGLALGGGGARGIAHIGVIRALEEMNIPIDYIAGTSMGSIAGGLYSCGFTPAEMEAVIKSIKWETLFQDAPDRPEQSFRQKEDDFEHLIPLEFGLNLEKGGLVLPPGLIAGSKLGFVLDTTMLPCSVASFDELRIPFRAVATDIQTGEPYVMSKGSLARSIRASMAIPAIFTPVEIDGHLLIDGGESQNLPVQTVRAMGADIVIAVNVGESGAETAEKPTNVGAMIGRLIDLPLQQNTKASAKLADFVITPNLEGYTSADFIRGTEMIPLGYEATMADKAKLERYAEPESVYRTWKLGHDATKPPLPVIDAIEIDPVPGVDPRRLSYLVKTKAGQVLDTKTLGSDLKRIYSMGIFEIVSYEIVRDGDRNLLHITPTLKSWGPTFLKLGLFLGTDFQLVTQFDVVALIDATQLNSLGGEWKTLVKVGTPLSVETRFFQPLNYEGRLFLSPFGGWRQDLSRVFDEEGDALATYQVSRGAVGMELGYDFGTVAELRAGYVRAFGKARRKVGDVIFPELDWDEGGFTARLEVDQLDNVNVPHSGYFARADYLGNRESLGGTESYDRFSAGALGAQTIGRWTGLLRGEGGTGMGRAIPFYDDFQLGGLFRLSGRPFGQIRGDKYVLALAMLYYRLTAHGGTILKSLSLGVSAEAGNAYEFQAPMTFGNLKTAGSIYFIADTLLGPFFFGYGRSNSSNSAAYLYLNRSF